LIALEAFFNGFNDVVKEESDIGTPLVSQGKTNPNILFVSTSYSTLAMMQVASSLMATTNGALCFVK